MTLRMPSYRALKQQLPSQSIDSELEIKTNSISTNGSISRQHLRKIFDTFDYNSTGTLNISEFSSVCYCIVGKKNLSNIDILAIFHIIDKDKNGNISFDEFCELIQPSDIHITDVSQAFATTYIDSDTNTLQLTDKYPSPRPPPSKFDDDYVSIFWSRDMGVSLCSGTHGINAYIKWRFTENARLHISPRSKIIAINEVNMNGLLFQEVTDFLNIVIITRDGFRVKFRPSSKLNNDRYVPSDFRTLNGDEVSDLQLLAPQFDKKKRRKRSLRKLLTAQHSIRDTNHRDGAETSVFSIDDSLTSMTNLDFGLHREESMFDLIENCKIPNCWFTCPHIIRKTLCIKRVSTVSELKRYGTHCRHCPLKKKKCRSILHNILDNEKHSKLSYGIQIFIMIMILISTLSYIIETLPVFNDMESAQKVFDWTEYTVSMIFTVEYVLRIIASRNICVFFWDILNLIDFVAIIPFWIELISGAQGSNALRVIRVIRLARVFRLMKSPRFAEYMAILHRTLVNSMGSFGLFLTLIFLEIIIASSLVYVCEQSMDNTKFVSIPTTSWWAFVTVTTIGYGDMVPQSIMGRIICVFTLFSGLLVIALPVIIIGGNFSEEYGKYLQQKAGWTASFKFTDSNYNENKKEQIFTVARLLHFINHKQCKDIFEWKDVKYLCDDGLDSFEIINKILTFDHGHCYLPSEFSSYKKYALFEYGKQFRINKNKNKEYKLSLKDSRKTKSLPPPSIKDINWAQDIAHLIHDHDDTETDILLNHSSSSDI